VARLTAKGRKAIKSSNFVYPAQKKYPIDTIERARSALQLVAKNGTEEEKKKVRAAVYRKYPQLRKTAQAARSAVKKKRS
jgi:hypothetical protein